MGQEISGGWDDISDHQSQPASDPRREDLLPDDIDDPELLLRALARFPGLIGLIGLKVSPRVLVGNMGEAVECHAKVRKYQFEPGP